MDIMTKKLSYFEKLPLPPNFFPRPELTENATQRLLELADITAEDLVHYARLTNGPLPWHLDVENNDLQMYKADDPDAPPSTRSVAWKSIVASTLDEIATMFNTDIDDPVAYREYCREFHNNALDGVRLYCLERSVDRYVGVHWTVNELPGLIKNKDVCLVKNRDWCFLETQTWFDMDDGRRAWVRALTSLEFASCPSLKASLGFVRGNYHRAGHVFVESHSNPGHVDVTEILQFDYGGDLTEIFQALELKKRTKAHRNLEKKLQTFRLRQIPLLPECALVPRRARTHCNVCSHKFGLLLKRTRCRSCGEVVCGNCSKSWPLSHTSVRLCVLCSAGLNESLAIEGSNSSESVYSMASTTSATSRQFTHGWSRRLESFDLGIQRKTFSEESFYYDDLDRASLYSIATSQYEAASNASTEDTDTSSVVSLRQQDLEPNPILSYSTMRRRS
ncbi:hypothetical protein AC1031_006044 [Aphanomyces cochlioides]|nr:hypothetical protein AC1031_006044 [Aphanomyces cochlioides]